MNFFELASSQCTLYVPSKKVKGLDHCHEEGCGRLGGTKREKRGSGITKSKQLSIIRSNLFPSVQ